MSAPAAAPSSSSPSLAPPEGVPPYFAYGSMMNPVSLMGRKLAPSRSTPAILNAYALAFNGKAGMGNVVPLAAEEEEAPQRRRCHGVLHWLTSQEMAALDKIEAVYDRVVTTAKDYSGAEHACTVYVMKPEHAQAKGALPSERYLDVISVGAEHFGVNKDYVATIRAHPCVPRKQRHELLSLPHPPVNSPTVHHTRLAAFADAHLPNVVVPDGHVATVFALNGKVLEVCGPKERMMMWGSNHGRDMTVTVAQYVYEPKYGGRPPATLQDMTEEHRLFTEDILQSFLTPTEGSAAHVRLLPIATVDYSAVDPALPSSI